MDPHTHPKRPDQPPLLPPEVALSAHRRSNRRPGRIEAGDNPITGVLEHCPARGLDSPRQHHVMALQRHTHDIGVRRPQPSRTLDIGEQKHRERHTLTVLPAHQPRAPKARTPPHVVSVGGRRWRSQSIGDASWRRASWIRRRAYRTASAGSIATPVATQSKRDSPRAASRRRPSRARRVGGARPRCSSGRLPAPRRSGRDDRAHR